MLKIIKKYNKNLSKKLIAKITTVEDWYKVQLHRSRKEMKGFWYQKGYK